MVGETQLMRMVEGEYVPSVRAEILEYDDDVTRNISNYCVVTERANHTLQDLLSIWASAEVSQ